MNIRRQTIQFNRLINGLLLTAVIGSSGALAQEWVPLEGGLPSETTGLFRPSLAGDPNLNPVLGFGNDGVSVVRWNGNTWESLGFPITYASGPSIGIDAQKRLYLCDSGKYAGTGAPNVFRWKGQSWLSIGGDIATEAGYNSGVGRHVVDACGGIALDSSGNPIVTWEAEVGVKSWAVFAARWDKDQQSWKGLGEGYIAVGQAVTTYIDIDANDRPYLATTSTIGYGLSRVTTTQVWRWNGRAWAQLGADMPGAETTVIGVYENAPYLALHYVERDATTGIIYTDELRVMRWREGSWQALPSPGKGFSPALDFTPSGKPVVAYLESLNEGQTLNILAKYWTGKTWQSAGDKVASLSCDPPALCFPQALLDLSLDSQGRPVVAWGWEYYTLTDGTATPVNRLNVKRYSSALP